MVPTAIGDRGRFHVSEPGAAVDEEDPGEDVLDPPEDLLLLNESGIIFESVPPSDPSRVPFTSLSTARSLSASYPTSLARLAVAHRHLGSLRVVDYVEIRHQMSILIPHEPTP